MRRSGSLASVSSAGMRRQVSGGAESSQAGSVAGTEIEEEGEEEQVEVRAVSPVKPPSVKAAEEPSDPFSLKAADSRRALEAVSCSLSRLVDSAADRWLCRLFLNACTTSSPPSFQSLSVVEPRTSISCENSIVCGKRRTSGAVCARRRRPGWRS